MFVGSPTLSAADAGISRDGSELTIGKPFQHLIVIAQHKNGAKSIESNWTSVSAIRVLSPL